MGVSKDINKEWFDIGYKEFGNLYQMTRFGKVRIKPYKFFKNGELHHSNGRVLEVIDRNVFLSNGIYRALYKIGTLHNHTFPEDLKKSA